MRSETIADEIQVVRWDERKGRATVTDMGQVEAVLAHYGLPLADKLLFMLENQNFLGHCAMGDFPCTVTIERKPKGTVQEAAWAFAEESRMARIELQGEELGVHFLDEDKFVPFSRLAFDPKTGFSIVESEG